MLAPYGIKDTGCTRRAGKLQCEHKEIFVIRGSGMPRLHLNKVTFAGNLVEAPEIRNTNGGDKVANLRIATTESWKKDNEWKERSTFMNVVVWNQNLIPSVEKMVKGDNVYAEGKIDVRKWKDNENNDRYATEILVDRYNGYVKRLTDHPGDESASDRPTQTAPSFGSPEDDDGIPY